MKKRGSVRKSRKVQRNSRSSKVQFSRVREAPFGVKLISVLYFIATIGLVLAGLVFIIGGGFLGDQLQQYPMIAAFGTSTFIVTGIILIVIGVLVSYIAKGLWNGHNGARIVVIIIALLMIIQDIISMMNGNLVGNVLSLIIHALIAGYLTFSPRVKAFFYRR